MKNCSFRFTTTTVVLTLFVSLDLSRITFHSYFCLFINSYLWLSHVLFTTTTLLDYMLAVIYNARLHLLILHQNFYLYKRTETKLGKRLENESLSRSLRFSWGKMDLIKDNFAWTVLLMRMLTHETISSCRGNPLTILQFWLIIMSAQNTGSYRANPSRN